MRLKLTLKMNEAKGLLDSTLRGMKANSIIVLSFIQNILVLSVKDLKLICLTFNLDHIVNN